MCVKTVALSLSLPEDTLGRPMELSKEMSALLEKTVAKFKAEAAKLKTSVEYHAEGVVALRRDQDGKLDTSRAISDLEIAAGGELKVTDWIDSEIVTFEYNHITADQVPGILARIDLGDFDDLIDKDGRRQLLNTAISEAGLSYTGDEDEDVSHGI